MKFRLKTFFRSASSHWICIWCIIGKYLTFIFGPLGRFQGKRVQSKSSLLILSLQQSVSLVLFSSFSMNTRMRRTGTAAEKLEQTICVTCSGDSCLNFHLVRADSQQTTWWWCNVIVFIHQTFLPLSSEFLSEKICSLISESINRLYRRERESETKL